jgi:hypothetical protein
MSSYNILIAELVCPRCVRVGVQEIEFKFGILNFHEYGIGDSISWSGQDERYPRDRPPQGNYVGEGYVECQFCGKDFWVDIVVSDDMIVRAMIVSERKGYVP